VPSSPDRLLQIGYTALLGSFFAHQNFDRFRLTSLTVAARQKFAQRAGEKKKLERKDETKVRDVARQIGSNRIYF